MNYINNILFSIGFYIGVDCILKYYKIEGRYYFNHMICNSLVVYNTFHSMLNSYDINNIITNQELESLYISRCAIYGLHLYHTIWYYDKLRRDDWLHHILMIGIVLPLTSIIPQHNIISHGIFFTTGLPGLIDYTLLFLNRNNIVPRYIEKKINSSINLWIRAPGCIMNTSLGISQIILNYNILTNYQFNSIIIINGLIYWNGIYFMKQALVDYIKHY
jgi:hypothetical protein